MEVELEPLQTCEIARPCTHLGPRHAGITPKAPLLSATTLHNDWAVPTRLQPLDCLSQPGSSLPNSRLPPLVLLVTLSECGGSENDRKTKDA